LYGNRAKVVAREGDRLTFLWPCGHKRTEVFTIGKGRFRKTPSPSTVAMFARYWADGVTYECPRCRREAIRGEKKPVRRGTRFRHARLLDADYSTPLECVVTAVRQGDVYYRPVEGGSPGVFPLADWNRWTLPFSGQIQGT
jgi:hypothetical protein